MIWTKPPWLCSMLIFQGCNMEHHSLEVWFRSCSFPNYNLTRYNGMSANVFDHCSSVFRIEAFQRSLRFQSCHRGWLEGKIQNFGVGIIFWMAWKGRERLLCFFLCVCFCVVLKSWGFFFERLQLMNILWQLYSYVLLAISMDVSSFRLTNMLPLDILIFPDQIIPCTNLIDELLKSKFGQKGRTIYVGGYWKRKT